MKISKIVLSNLKTVSIDLTPSVTTHFHNLLRRLFKISQFSKKIGGKLSVFGMAAIPLPLIFGGCIIVSPNLQINNYLFVLYVLVVNVR